MELLILLVGAFLGGMMAWAIKISASKMKLILAFSGAFMLGLCFFHVLPESYEAVGHQAGIWVLATQLRLKYVSTTDLTPDHSSKLWFNARGAPRVIWAQAGAINTRLNPKGLQETIFMRFILVILNLI